MLDEQAQTHPTDMDMDVGMQPIPTAQTEKIIFCIDLNVSMDEQFMLGEILNDTRINRTKQVLKWFIAQKSNWNPNHEFAVIILGETAVWHVDFTTDTVLLEHAVDELYTMGEFSSFDLPTLFQLIMQNVDFSIEDGPTVRAIMLYTRSDVLPTLSDTEHLEALRATRKFFFDCVYIHNKASEVPGDIKPQEIYDRLTEMEDARSPGYFYELTRALKKFSGAMGELLANPGLRTVQQRGFPRMEPPPSVRAKMEMIEQQKQQRQQQQLQLQQQQQNQQHAQSQAPSPNAKRTEIPVKYKSPDMTGVSPSSSFFGGAVSAAVSSQLPITPTGGSNSGPRTPPPPPSRASGTTSPFGSMTSPSRGSKTEHPLVSSRSGSMASPSRGSKTEFPLVSSRTGSMTSPSRGSKTEIPLVNSRSGSMTRMRSPPSGPDGPGGAAGGGSRSGTGLGVKSGAGTGMDDAILI